MSSTASRSARYARAEPGVAADPGGAGWQPRFASMHAGAGAVLLLAVAIWQLTTPGLFLSKWSGAALLVGGAVTGLPHGMSDFLVAHRLLQPRLGRNWLPIFVGAYLALALLVVGGWSICPVFTMVLFLLVSGFHFGAPEPKPDRDRHAAITLVARATTPLVPIFLLHPIETGPFIAVMTGLADRQVYDLLIAVRPFLLSPWVALVALSTLSGLGFGGSGCEGRLRRAEAAELFALSFAAVVAPPLITFAIYFCLVHAIRHMAHLTGGFHPHQARRAVRLALVIVSPSALLCLSLLAAVWSSMAGFTGTTPLICEALQLLAALTVPHMALECVERFVVLSRPRPSATVSRGGGHRVLGRA